MIINLRKATLIERYKRFLADITLADGTTTTIHVANTGAMSGCAESGNSVFYSTSENPKRKYPFSWEVSQTKANHFICVNTLRANQLVEEALNAGVISELVDFSTLQREVKYGKENSRIDFLLLFDPTSHDLTLKNTKPLTYIEVKSVTLLDDTIENNQGQGFFPDAVSIRGQKHLRELMDMVQQGHRAVLLFAVLHTGINRVSAAEHIDEKYADLLRQAQQMGVEILAYKANFSIDASTVDMQLSERIPFNCNINDKNIDSP